MIAGRENKSSSIASCTQNLPGEILVGIGVRAMALVFIQITVDFHVTLAASIALIFLLHRHR